MRKRKYLIGLVAGLAIAVAAPSLAQATVGPTTITPLPTATKQEKKVRGGTGLDFTIDTKHSAGALQPASNVAVDFPKDWKFDAGSLPRCNPVTLQGTVTEAAKGICGSSEVGSGFATLCDPTGACNGRATVTAFNGNPSGGALSLLLHTRITTGINTTLVLDGTLIPSPLGGAYGSRLNVNTPDSSSSGQQLSLFQVTIPKQVSKKKKKTVNGKKTTVKTYYIAAKCSKKSWSFDATSAHRNGGETTNANATVACKQKKAKGKK